MGRSFKLPSPAGKAYLSSGNVAVEKTAKPSCLAHSRHLLLHVEHIELLGGVHQALMVVASDWHSFYAVCHDDSSKSEAPQSGRTSQNYLAFRSSARCLVSIV
jgi:hypothetical protein